MSNNIPSRYRYLIEELKPFVAQSGLDWVSVASLIQGCVRFQDFEEDSATVVFINVDKLSESRSVKFSNIKVSLRYALDVIFAAKMIPNMEDIWLILAVLKTIICLTAGLTELIEKDEAVVLFAIYRLRRADEREIRRYIENKMNDILGNIEIESLDVEKSARLLEKIGSIQLVDGKYRLVENVIISKNYC